VARLFGNETSIDIENIKEFAAKGEMNTKTDYEAEETRNFF
jgi:hypothetical protein